jgi:ABC-type nitrate/sulfonate/bicarbonate transport system substrate-binding protein
MGKLPTDQELKARWAREKIARKHQDAAEVMYEALREIQAWIRAHPRASEAEIAPLLENVERIASAALTAAEGGRPQCRTKL